MKKIYFLLVFLFSLGFFEMNAQFDVLFVDDTDDTFNNAETLHAAIESVGYPATYYNAADSAVGPSDLYMSNFDLVVWHTSTDGNSLLLWNGLDEDNASLEAYLNNGGRLWLTGNDFLFDRYEFSPVIFQEGDFVYDYLGVSSFDEESFNTDGETGVPMMVADENSVITGLNDLTWVFATLWYGDGVSLVDGANPIYRMGDDSYVLADTISGAYYDNGTSQVLTYFFDLALASNIVMMEANILPVMTFFEEMIVSQEDIDAPTFNVEIYPNPVQNSLNLELELKFASKVTLSILDVTGKKIMTLMSAKRFESGVQVLNFDLNASINSGFYYVNIEMDDSSIMKPVFVRK